jgi:hypothetical protein
VVFLKLERGVRGVMFVGVLVLLIVILIAALAVAIYNGAPTASQNNNAQVVMVGSALPTNTPISTEDILNTIDDLRQMGKQAFNEKQFNQFNETLANLTYTVNTLNQTLNKTQNSFIEQTDEDSIIQQISELETQVVMQTNMIQARQLQSNMETKIELVSQQCDALIKSAEQ